MLRSSLSTFLAKPSLFRSTLLFSVSLGVLFVIRNGSLHQLSFVFASLLIIGISLVLLDDRNSHWKDLSIFVPSAAGTQLVQASADFSSSSSSFLSSAPEPTLSKEVDSSSDSTLVSGLRLAPPRNKRIVVAVTGATGALLAIRLLEILKELGIETYLILSKWAVATLKYETDMTAAEVSPHPSFPLVQGNSAASSSDSVLSLSLCFSSSQIRALATTSYQTNDMAAPPSSGSFLHDGMVIVPCESSSFDQVKSLSLNRRFLTLPVSLFSSRQHEDSLGCSNGILQ